MGLRVTLCVSMLVAASPASAAEDFIKGVYLQTQELCAQAKKDTLQTLIDTGNVILSADGLQSVEYNCEFVQVTKATRSPSWAVTAICQEPGFLFPDILSITQMNDPNRHRLGAPDRRRRRAGRQWRQLLSVRGCIAALG